MFEQIPSLYKFYSFNEDVPEEILDKIDVCSFFYHNLFDISQSQHRMIRVGKDLNKKSFAIKLFQYGDIKKQQRYFLQET